MVGGQRYAPANCLREKDPVPIVQLVGWAMGPVWTGAENCAPTVIRCPERPDRSESPYRLRDTQLSVGLLMRGLIAEHYTSEALPRYSM